MKGRYQDARTTESFIKPTVLYNEIIKGIPILKNADMNSISLTTEKIESNYSGLHISSTSQSALKRQHIMTLTNYFILVHQSESEKKSALVSSKLLEIESNLILLLIPYSLMESLNDLSFQINYKGKNVISNLVWVFFLLDFITSFFFLKGKTKKNFYTQKEIAMNYLKTWAVFDFIPLIPARFFGKPRIEAVFKLTRVVKVNQLIQKIEIKHISRFCIRKMMKTDKRYIRTEFGINIIFEFVLTVVYMALLSISMAELWWFFSDFFSETSQVDENFIDFYSLKTEKKQDQIIKTMYFITTSLFTIGYGDFLPKNFHEMGVDIALLMLIGIFFSALTIIATSLLSNFQKLLKTNKLQLSIRKLLNILKHKHGRLADSKQSSILSHFSFYETHDRLGSLLKTEDFHETHPFFDPLPEPLKKQLLETLFKDYFGLFKMIFSDKLNLKYEICRFLQPRCFSEEDVLIEDGQKADELLFVTCGSVCLKFQNLFDDFRTCKTFEGNFMIGEYSVVLNKPSFGFFIAAEPVEGLCLPKVALRGIIKLKFSSFYQELKKIVKRRSMKLLNLMESCGFESNHQLVDYLKNC